jgi:hypothetical protein
VVNSRAAAGIGITQVVFSRIVMAAPGMTVLPVIMEKLEAKSWMQKSFVKPLHGPIQVSYKMSQPFCICLMSVHSFLYF